MASEEKNPYRLDRTNPETQPTHQAPEKKLTVTTDALPLGGAHGKDGGNGDGNGNGNGGGNGNGLTDRLSAPPAGFLPFRLIRGGIGHVTNSSRKVIADIRSLKEPIAPQDIEKYRVGNILYSKKTLVWLFFWMLWSGFVCSLFESVAGPVVDYWFTEFKVKPSTLVYLGLIPTILTFFLVPMISVASDRHRGPRGRRIPFMAFSAPFVGGILILLGFGRDIGAWLYPMLHAQWAWLTPVDVTVGVIATIGVVLTFANLFLTTIGYYLMNDVVPKAFMTQFIAYSQMVGIASGLIFNTFVFPYTDATDVSGRGQGTINFFGLYEWTGIYGKLLLIVAGILGMTVYTMACLKIKEPSYPPPPGNLDKRPGFFSTVKTYFDECYTHKFYLLLFFGATAIGLADFQGIPQIRLWKHLGMDAQTVGHIQNASTIATLLLLGVVGSLCAKVRPIKLYLWSLVGLIVTCPIGFLYLIPDLSANTYVGIRVAYVMTHIPINIVQNIGGPLLLIALLPKLKFGQFSAAGGMIRLVVAGILGKIAAGQTMTFLEDHMGQYAYRFIHVWSFFWLLVAMAIYLLVFREWKRLGGDNYTPPVAGEPVKLTTEAAAEFAHAKPAASPIGKR